MIDVVLGAGTACLMDTDGVSATLHASIASPPGSLFRFSLAETTYRLKVRACRRSEESERPFRIEGRLIDLTREHRETLVQALASRR